MVDDRRHRGGGYSTRVVASARRVRYIYSLSSGRTSGAEWVRAHHCTRVTKRGRVNSAQDTHWIANFIWGIADDVLRDLYVRGKYRDVILPMTVLQRLDGVLAASKADVLAMKANLDAAGVTNQEDALRSAAKLPFYNTSVGLLHDEVTSDLWCREVPLEGCSPCPSPIPRSSART